MPYSAVGGDRVVSQGDLTVSQDILTWFLGMGMCRNFFGLGKFQIFRTVINEDAKNRNI